ncbi:MAG: dihydroorotate dehydrogenase [Bacillota bacterium]|nr:dihydroorotate dehydrogenase [Bacillota bacterium]
MANLQVSVAGIELKNPLITASGTCGYGRELAELFDLSLLGGISVKGTTLQPRAGNPTPRIAETASGMLNSVGLQNPGIDRVIATEIPFLRRFNTAIIINIAGHSVEDYRAVAARLEGEAGVAGIEVNISCPNVSGGGMAFGVDPAVAAEVISAVRGATRLPLIAKLSPNVTDIVAIAAAVKEAGCDAVSLINTLHGMVIDVEKRAPLLANKFGGLSGPAVKPIALRMVWQVYEAVDIPIIGLGGISSAEDAIEFIMAGASAFQIGSASFHDPQAAPRIIEQLDDWLDAHGVSAIGELVGAAH